MTSENNKFDFPLSEFEKITLDQEILYYPGEIYNPDKVKAKVRAMCLKWNINRTKKGLKAW